MKKNVGVLVLVFLILGVLGLMLISFQVRETERAFVMRLGKPVRHMNEPGLYFKWPTPIEKVRKYDARLRLYEADLIETSTRGAVPIVIKTYVIWRIEDPLEFYRSIGSVKEARRKLYSQINDTQNRIVGQHSFSDFVNGDPNKIKIDEIQQEMLADLRKAMQTEYGIKIATLGIKQFMINEDTTEKVFERMRAARNTKTTDTISRGVAEATRITAEATAMQKELLAAAESRAKEIAGQGDADAAKYFGMLDESPEFAIFLQELESLKSMLAERTTLVIPTDVGPFDLLRGVPDLKE